MIQNLKKQVSGDSMKYKLIVTLFLTALSAFVAATEKNEQEPKKSLKDSLWRDDLTSFNFNNFKDKDGSIKVAVHLSKRSPYIDQTLYSCDFTLHEGPNHKTCRDNEKPCEDLYLNLAATKEKTLAHLAKKSEKNGLHISLGKFPNYGESLVTLIQFWIPGMQIVSLFFPNIISDDGVEKIVDATNDCISQAESRRWLLFRSIDKTKLYQCIRNYGKQFEAEKLK